MDATTIEVAVAADGTRGSITLNRPATLNPLGTETLVELARAGRWFDDEHPSVKVVVVSGAGRAFTAGSDLAGFSGPSGDADPDAGRRMADAIESMRAVTVARLHGYCIGGGVVLASACDLRVAADTTVFSIPEVDLGIPLTWGGIPRLVREIGPAMTKELVMTCRRFSAAEAQSYGLVNRVVPEAALDDEVETLVSSLVEKSSLCLSATKRHVDAVTAVSVGLARTWNDADSLVAALRDPESRAAGARYLERVRRR